MVLTLFATSTTSLIIYKSTIPIEKSDYSNIIGLKYFKEPNQILNPNNGFSTCLRFNYEKLNSYVFYYGQSKDASIQFDVKWDILKNGISQGNLVYVQKGKTVFHIPWFGYSNTSTLSVNIWNHICISFNIKSRNVTLVVVKYLMFIIELFYRCFKTFSLKNGLLQFNQKVNSMEDLEWPKNFLDAIHVGRISGISEYNSIPTDLRRVSHPNQLTDFNLWNKTLSVEDMIAWTSCK